MLITGIKVNNEARLEKKNDCAIPVTVSEMGVVSERGKN